MQAEFAKSPVRPWWRRVLRAFIWIFLILLTPVVSFVAYNRFDEAPSELALKFENMPMRPVSDADNAWLAMVGLGAADDVDPIAWGRQKVDAFNATPMQSVANSSEPAIESSQPEDAHVTIWPDPKPPIDDRHCPKRDVDCLQWALDRATRLRGFQQANAVLLTRLDALMQLPEWQARYQQRVDTPMLDWGILAAQLDLLALDLAEAQASASEVDVDASLQKLAGSVEFWQRVRAQPQDLFTVLFSGALIERAYWIANAWLDRAGQEQITRHGLLLDRVLKPASGPVQWQRAVADQYLLFRNGMADLDPGLGTVLWRCVTDSASEGCLESLTTSASFAPQATFNLQAINCEQILRVLEASPRDHEEVAADAGRIMQEMFPNFEDIGALLSQMSYNYTGRILAAISIPAFDWSKREHDREALRRMIVLKRMALESGVPAESLVSVISLQDSTLGNPLTGNPFDWDATSRVLYFEPSAKQDWKRERVEIAYRR